MKPIVILVNIAVNELLCRRAKNVERIELLMLIVAITEV